MLRRQGAAIAGLSVLVLLAACGGSDGEAPQAGETTLTIVAWGGKSTRYQKTLFADPFSKATGIQTHLLSAPGKQVAGIQAQHRAGRIQWDVLVALLGNQSVYLKHKGLLMKLPADVKQHLQKRMPGGITDYGMIQGTLSNVISCNRKTVTNCPSNPAQFFNVRQYPGARALNADSPMVAMALALAADGVAPDKIYPMDIDRAFRKLHQLRPQVKLFWSSGDQSEQMFRNGEVDMAILWNGRARDLTRNPTDRMTIETSWTQAIYQPAYTAVPKGTPNANAAFKYMTWVADHPKQQAKYAKKTAYGFPGSDYLSYLSKDQEKWVPEDPGHFSGQIRLNYEWYFEHKSEVDTRWKEFVSGG